MIKDTQGLKISTRSDRCEIMLGIYPIVSEIDKRKLLFFGKICKLDTVCLTRNMFLAELYDLINNDGGPERPV